MSDTPFETDSQYTQVDLEWQTRAIPLPVGPKIEDSLVDAKYEVTLDPKDDPMNFTVFKKWTIVLTICSAALCVASASSAVCPLGVVYLAIYFDAH